MNNVQLLWLYNNCNCTNNYIFIFFIYCVSITKDMNFTETNAWYRLLIFIKNKTAREGLKLYLLKNFKLNKVGFGYLFESFIAKT